ncbi:hypothetical protein RIF29_18659 [Crotalaria pallida]|uniref:VAN3-binding protein-like auxin canalisation domain-containing protein n=1 Tax=Crotalaria pallida TaxID=3830 RepID=A0AAN9I708_CROPI
METKFRISCHRNVLVPNNNGTHLPESSRVPMEFLSRSWSASSLEVSKALQPPQPSSSSYKPPNSIPEQTITHSDQLSTMFGNQFSFLPLPLHNLSLNALCSQSTREWELEWFQKAKSVLSMWRAIWSKKEARERAPSKVPPIMLGLRGNNVKVVNRISEQIIEELQFDQTSDSASKGRDMWKVYLDMKEYGAALANCRDPFQRDQVYLVQAGVAFSYKDYFRSAVKAKLHHDHELAKRPKGVKLWLKVRGAVFVVERFFFLDDVIGFEITYILEINYILSFEEVTLKFISAGEQVLFILPVFSVIGDMQFANGVLLRVCDVVFPDECF